MKGKFIKAKFQSNCSETGKTIKKGEDIFYHFTNQKGYCSTSDMYENQNANQTEAEDNHHKIMIEFGSIPEFQSFYQQNNI